ncbi:MAG TPA: hypothetical protein PLI12_10140, partial [Acetobacteraceae bacterium]|nr:hypothetical protein [Acetobacteraceae bacterium]
MMDSAKLPSLHSVHTQYLMSYPHLPLEEAIIALRAILPLDAPADVTLSRYFRENPMLGMKDRAFIAELVFGVLRRQRSLEAATGKGTPRQLALAWLLKRSPVMLPIP